MQRLLELRVRNLPRDCITYGARHTVVADVSPSLPTFISPLLKHQRTVKEEGEARQKQLQCQLLLQRHLANAGHWWESGAPSQPRTRKDAIRGQIVMSWPSMT